MKLNPLTWPLAGKIAGGGVAALVVAGGSFGAVTAFSHPAPRSAHSAASSPQAGLGLITPSAAPAASQAAPAGLAAFCQAGSGGQAVSAQNYDPGELDYLITVTNDSGQPVTLTGYTVTFTAFGQTIDAEVPAINPVLAEPGEKWAYTGSYANAPQVSQATYLDETCTVTEVDTPDGPVVPESSSGQNGDANTHAQDVTAAQQQLGQDVSALSSDSHSLDTDTSLAGDLQSMKSDYGTEQQDYQTEQSDGCPAASGDASAVSGDASAVSGDESALQGDEGSLKNDGIASVTTDLANVQKDVAAIQGFGASPRTATSSAVTAGNKALSDAASAISYATGQGNTYISEANQLTQTAANWASNHGCPV